MSDALAARSAPPPLLRSRAEEPHAPTSDVVPGDAALMARAARGDVSAFARIYDLHAGAVLALARRMLAAKSDAQDLLHDVFLEAWQSSGEYDSARASVRTWLLVRTRSRALDRRARSERESSARDQLVDQQHASGLRRVVLPQTVRQLAVRQALSRLEPCVREALELTYFEGMTAIEVGMRMHTPDGTVRSRLARGLETLQRVLSQLEENDT